ncbi:MAG: MarR family transcriptional regulator [Rhodoferax sp.]|uniref:MarR family winged helix-turn-helix transcriptional regulator n=1 Tax=Rhodoferax sp. TaxID=50421 RepID=UPI002ACD5B47|nr:MarR family transcriptional regulator [Rhodoferax sp.]MDZ7891503.1 MarR family transcriptional regulator [Rhodoferax sp.]
MNNPNPAPEPTDNAAQALRQFRVVFNAVRTHFRQIEKDTGLGGAQIWALSLIQNSPGLGISDIALQMDIHQSTASNLVKVLVKKELITLTKSAQDKRMAELRVTPEGKQALAKNPGPYEGVLPNALRQLDETTLANINRDLGKLVQLLAVDEAARNIPLADL